MRVVAWISRFKDYLKENVIKKKNRSSDAENLGLQSGNLKVNELNEAEKSIVCYVQSTSFPEVFKALQDGGSMMTNAKCQAKSEKDWKLFIPPQPCDKGQNDSCWRTP